MAEAGNLVSSYAYCSSLLSYCHIDPDATQKSPLPGNHSLKGYGVSTHSKNPDETGGRRQSGRAAGAESYSFTPLLQIPRTQFLQPQFGPLPLDRSQGPAHSFYQHQKDNILMPVGLLDTASCIHSKTLVLSFSHPFVTYVSSLHLA